MCLRMHMCVFKLGCMCVHAWVYVFGVCACVWSVCMCLECVYVFMCVLKTMTVKDKQQHSSYGHET